eukprot:Seg318.18 transcript_id=Seg318.18/GoldUCD/mRNA.D3Y31 product="hypothetical protein" protein_id=Seg318.18/GoldUCD/D3Y31
MAPIKLLVHLLLAVVFHVDTFTFEVVRKYKDDPYPANKDTFQKGVYSYGNDKVDITECNSTYVHGGVEVDHSNSRICKCAYGQTFYINAANNLPPKPTCIKFFGQEELDCRFKFKGKSYVLALKQNGASSQDIGTVQYDYTDARRIQQVIDVYFWNVTWQKLEQVIFASAGATLKWKNTSSDLMTKYEGLLFMVNMQIKVQGNSKTSCVLLKIEGKRNYPLQPYVKISSRSDVMSSTRILPELSTSKVMRSSSNFVMKTSTPIYKSEISSFLSKPSTSLKTTSLVKSTQIPSKVTSSPSTPIIQTSAAHSQTTRSLKTTTTSYVTATPNESTMSLKTQDSSFAIKSSSSYESYNTRGSSQIKSPYVAPSSSAGSSVMLSSSIIATIITNPGGNAGKQQSSNAGMIAGISVGVIVAIAAVVAVAMIYRRRLGRRHPSLDEIRRRKGTMTLDLTANTFSNRGLSFQNPVKKDVGNPMYADKLRFNSPGEAIYKEIDDDGKMEPIYREIETEEPIYHETESEYQPIDEAKLDSPANYEALNTAAFPKEEPSYLKPVQAPIYQELEEENSAVDKTKDEPYDANLVQAPIYQVLEEDNDGKHNNNRNAKNEAQSPVYQTLNPEVYEELDRSSTKSPDAVYSKLDLPDKNRPKQEPLYDVLARESGTSNIQYDDDEAEI